MFLRGAPRTYPVNCEHCLSIPDSAETMNNFDTDILSSCGYETNRSGLGMSAVLAIEIQSNLLLAPSFKLACSDYALLSDGSSVAFMIVLVKVNFTYDLLITRISSAFVVFR